jgi:restriction system protein
MKKKNYQKIILDYSNYITVISEESAFNLLPNVNTLSKKFYYRHGKCPNCNTQTFIVFEDGYYSYFADLGMDITIYNCKGCGWWEQIIVKREGIGLIKTERNHRSILRKYSVSDKNIPIETLNQFLLKNKKSLFDIHPTQMERIVQKTLSSFYLCNVIHCGKSHDGGIDLFYVESDTPVAIQVKKHKSPSKVEPVKVIREILSAAQLKNYKEIVFVTTAHHFSKPAIKASEIAINLGIVNRFELIDFNRFVDLLNLTNRNPSEPWRQFVNIDYQRK